jgi:hypothetical protein
MSPYMKTIWEHLCWQKLCPHSLHPEANTTQSRQFGFVKKSSREMCNYTRSTLSNNWVTSLQKVSHVLFWISPEEDNGMVIPLTPNYSNVLVPGSRGSVVPRHWNLDI